MVGQEVRPGVFAAEILFPGCFPVLARRIVGEVEEFFLQEDGFLFIFQFPVFLQVIDVILVYPAVDIPGCDVHSAETIGIFHVLFLQGFEATFNDLALPVVRHGREVQAHKAVEIVV